MCALSSALPLLMHCCRGTSLHVCITQSMLWYISKVHKIKKNKGDLIESQRFYRLDIRDSKLHHHSFKHSELFTTNVHSQGKCKLKAKSICPQTKMRPAYIWFLCATDFFNVFLLLVLSDKSDPSLM